MEVRIPHAANTRAQPHMHVGTTPNSGSALNAEALGAYASAGLAATAAAPMHAPIVNSRHAAAPVLLRAHGTNLKESHEHAKSTGQCNLGMIRML